MKQERVLSVSQYAEGQIELKFHFLVKGDEDARTDRLPPCTRNYYYSVLFSIVFPFFPPACACGSDCQLVGIQFRNNSRLVARFSSIVVLLTET